MARTFGANGTDVVTAATSASLDASEPVGTLLIEVYPTTLTGGRVIASHLTAGADGWNFRLSGGSGEIEFRLNRSISALSYITNDTPLSVNTLRRVMVTWDNTSPSAPHIYHDKASPGVLAEATYGTTSLGSGTVTNPQGDPVTFGNNSLGTAVFQGRLGRAAIFKRHLSLSEAEAWFAQPRGDDADCQLFYCLGTSSPEVDFSGTSSATMNRNPGTVTGATVSQITAAAAFVTRTVGSGSRMITHVTDVQTTWLNGKDIRAVSGNLRYDFEMFDDSVFSFTADLLIGAGLQADPYVSETDDATKCCAIMRAALGHRHAMRKSAGVRWRRTTAPGAGTYLFECDVPGMAFHWINFEYTGGAVSADSIQIRMFRINHGALGQTEMHFGVCWDFNSGRAGASIVGFSFPGGAGYSCVVVNTGVGQEAGSTRNFSAAPTTTALGKCGFFGCSSYGSGGDGFRITANGVAVTAYLHNCISIGSTGPDFWHESVGGSDGTLDLKNNISGDGTADDYGGSGHQVNVVENDQYWDGPNGNLRLLPTSDAIGAGLDEGANNASRVDILGFDRHAAGVAWDVGAIQYSPLTGKIPGLSRESVALQRARLQMARAEGAARDTSSLLRWRFLTGAERGEARTASTIGEAIQTLVGYAISGARASAMLIRRRSVLGHIRSLARAIAKFFTPGVGLLDVQARSARCSLIESRSARSSLVESRTITLQSGEGISAGTVGAFTSLSQVAGSAAGGLVLRLNVSSISGFPPVKFGNVPAEDIVIVDANTISVKVPAYPGTPAILGTAVDVECGGIVKTAAFTYFRVASLVEVNHGFENGLFAPFIEGVGGGETVENDGIAFEGTRSTKHPHTHQGDVEGIRYEFAGNPPAQWANGQFSTWRVLIPAATKTAMQNGQIKLQYQRYSSGNNWLVVGIGPEIGGTTDKICVVGDSVATGGLGNSFLYPTDEWVTIRFLYWRDTVNNIGYAKWWFGSTVNGVFTLVFGGEFSHASLGQNGGASAKFNLSPYSQNAGNGFHTRNDAVVLADGWVP